MRVAFFGGSFDPPHVAHQRAVELLGSREDIDKVLVVPVHEHAFDKALAPFEHRVRMCELSLTGSGKAEVSRLEASLGRPNYTLYSLRALKALHPEYELCLVVGADVLAEAQRWHQFEAVRHLAPLLPLGRVGVAETDAPPPVLPEVSSTQIRNLLRGRSEARISEPLRDQLTELVAPVVLDYIERYDLYRA